MTRRYFTRAAFIAAWQGADSVAEVAAVTGLAKPSCRGRAAKYRREGHDLKSFRDLTRIDMRQIIDLATADLKAIRGTG